MNHLDTVTTYGLNAMSVSADQLGKPPGRHTAMNQSETGISYSSQGTGVGRSVNRRNLLKMIGFGTAALVVGGAGMAERAGARSTDTLIVNTAGTRLRSGPGTTYSILASLAHGTEVRYLADDGSANGYQWYQVRVLATGQEGFVASSLLSAPDGNSGADPVITGEGWTTSAVNLRSGPSTSNSVLQVVPSGTKIGVSTTMQNGFRHVSYEGQTGWMADAYISSSNGGSQPDPVVTGQRMTTSAVNLRSGPSTSNSVLRVIPSGSLVQSSDTIQNGFRYVVHLGVAGWIADSYLAFPTDMGPVPSHQTTTSALNLRAEPSTSAKILLVIPSGAKVSPNGDMSNGFAKVTYNGTSGWAFGDDLV